MELNLREIYPELFQKLHIHPVKPAEYYTVNVKRFFEETKFLLAGKSEHVSEKKVRPVLVVSIQDDKVRFIAFTTHLIVRQNRPSVNMDCEHIKPPQQCGVRQKKLVWIFGKKTSSGKRMRFHYEVEIHTFKKLMEEGSITLCGRCSDEMLQTIENLINKYGDVI